MIPLTGALCWLLTHALMGYLAAKLAEGYGHRLGTPSWCGAIVIGLVFHLPGLLGLWLVLWLSERADAGRASRDR